MEERKALTPTRVCLRCARVFRSSACRSASLFVVVALLSAVPLAILWTGQSVEALAARFSAAVSGAGASAEFSFIDGISVARFARPLVVSEDLSSFFGPQDFAAIDLEKGVTAEYLLKETGPVTARDANHLHGTVGVDATGRPVWSPEPLRFRMSRQDLEKAYEGYSFNTRVSKSLPLDRPAPDYTSAMCKAFEYDLSSLPKASVIFVFHNEDLSALLRSVHSVLNRSPPELLAEVILVDDNSNHETHPWLFEELDKNVSHLPKVRLRRLRERHGLMVARIRGAEWARGDVVVFLDSHIECAPRWLEPLVYRTFQDPRAIVVPMIHTLDHEYLEFQPGKLSVLGFTWSLGQTHPYRNESTFEPMPSPVMAGGLFAANKHWFVDVLDGYDREMRLYGGEEMEIGFKTWMCGGRLEALPCSRVGHIFRSPKYWKGQVYKVPGDEIHRNKLRAAAVWMDEYARLAQLSISRLPESNPLGDLSRAQAVREKCGSKSFQWYLDTVATDMVVPDISDWTLTGALKNATFGVCVDSFNGSGMADSHSGVYQCHDANGTQAWALDDHGNLLEAASLSRCLALGPKGLERTSRCNAKDDKTHHVWSRKDLRRKTVVDTRLGEPVEILESLFVFDGKCLEAVREADKGLSGWSARAADCDASRAGQFWYFQP